MRRKLFFLALVFITALTSQAQITVTGTVFDADEGEPLEYAVTAIMRDTAIVGRANTDEKGVHFLHRLFHILCHFQCGRKQRSR